MAILLIRHGETLLNAARTLQPADTGLSARGHAQARALAGRLAKAGVAAIVSSDLPRAASTAEALADATGLPIRWEPLLRERNFGDLRGRPYDGLGFDPLTLVHAPPGGESAETFRMRVAQAFQKIVALRRGLDGDLAVVTHGLVIAAMLESHAGSARAESGPSRLANTSVTVISARSPHAVERLNCTAHLEAEIGDDPASLSGG